MRRFPAILHDGPLNAGAHRLRLDAVAGGERITRKLVVAR